MTERALKPRAVDTLWFLARPAGPTGSRKQILDAAWTLRGQVGDV